MPTGNPQLAIACIVVGLALAVGRRPIGWPSKVVLSALLVGGWLWASRAVQDTAPTVQVTVQLTNAALKEGSVIDGLGWTPAHRRYSITISTDRSAPIMDLRVRIHMPDLVVQAKESGASGMACVHLAVPRGSATITREGQTPELLPESAALTNVITLSASRATPRSSLFLDAITLTGWGDDEGVVVAETVHDYWGADVSDPPVGYRIVVTDKTTRAVELDTENPMRGDFKVPTHTGAWQVPKGLPPGKGQLQFNFPAY